jgi:hypothetical protein
MNQLVKTKTHSLRTLLEKLDAAQAATQDVHAEALRAAREAFELQLVQAVHYRMSQALAVMTGD